MRARTQALLVLVAGLGGVLVALVLTSKLYRVGSPAMEPTFHCRETRVPGCESDSPDRIAVSRVLYRLRDPHRGDVVAFEVPARVAAQCGLTAAQTFVQRIVGLPGERWADRNGLISINGRKLTEPYVEHKGLQNLPTRRIPRGHYVVLGDNRNESCDSRIWGPLPRKRIIGPVIAVYWPLDRISIR